MSTLLTQSKLAQVLHLLANYTQEVSTEMECVCVNLNDCILLRNISAVLSRKQKAHSELL